MISVKHLRKLPSLVLMFAIFGISSCQDKSYSEAEINEYCKKVDQDLTKYTLKMMSGYPEPERRQINAYLDGENPVMMIEEYFGDSARVFTHYYINGNQFVYAFREDYIYNLPVWYTEDSARKLGDTVWYDDKKTVMKTESFYFSKNKLQKWIDGNHKIVQPGSVPFKKAEFELMEGCLYIVKAIKAKENE